MATTSYGSITIVDITDIGEFSVYPKANSSRTQIYNPDAVQHYIPNWDTSVDGGVAVVITPVAYYASQDVSTAATYVWQRRDGNGDVSALTSNEVVSTVDGNSGVLTISRNKLGDSTTGILSYIVTANYEVDGVRLQAVGEIDFSLARQGSAAKTAKINGSNIFKYNSERTVITPASIELTGTVAGVNISGWKYKNGNQWVDYPNSTSSNSLTVNPTDSTFANDQVTIRLVTSDATVYDQVTIVKLYDGVKGDAVVSAVLSNEDQMLPANAAGSVTSYAGATTELTIFEGGRDVTSEWTITKESTNVTDSEAATNKATITNISADTGYVTFTCTKTGYDTIIKKFSLVKVKTGADGKTPIIYSLEPTSVAVNKDKDGANPNPSTVTFYAYQQTGDNKAAYNGRIQFYIDDNSSIAKATTSDTASRTINFNDSPWNQAKKIRAVLYEAGANTKQLDTQTVVIVSDGQTGANGEPGAAGFGAINVVIDNEADVIPCNSSNKPLDTFIIDIGYQGYQGTTVKTTSVTAPNLTADDFGTVISPDTQTTAGHVKYTIPTTATLAANGTIQLQFRVSGQDYDAEGNVVDTNVAVNKLYSWTRSSAAVNGVNAVILQLITPDGTIFDNHTGQLTLSAQLYNGASPQSGVTYKWYEYSSGAYNEVTSTADTADIYKKGEGNSQLVVKANAVSGYKSIKVTCTYDSKTYEQYVSLIDKTDPLQVSLHSTVGTQIKNSQGIGCVYARVTRNGVEIDEVPMDIRSGTAYPSNPSENDKFVILSTETDSSQRTATLVKWDGSKWVTQIAKCKYEWSFRDSNNVPVTTGVPYQHTTEAQKNLNQFIYIDSTLISSKITIDCKVTLD